MNGVKYPDECLFKISHETEFDGEVTVLTLGGVGSNLS